MMMDYKNERIMKALLLSTVVFLTLWGTSVAEDCPATCLCLETAQGLVVNCSSRALRVVPTDIPNRVSVLDLSKNLLENVDRIPWGSYYNLSIVDISGNSLTEVINLESKTMGSLNLAGNRLTNDKLHLNGLPNLLSLNLSMNLINELNLRAVTSKLRYLDISQNELDEKGLISNLQFPNMEELFLSRNRFITLPKDMFKGFPNLRQLQIANAGIKDLDSLAFNGLQSLITLDLSKNLFNAFDTSILDSMPKVKLIKLLDSKIRCDCKAKSLKLELLKREIQTGGSVICYTIKPLLPHDILMTDMTQYCVQTTVAPPTPVVCLTPSLVLINATSSVAWLHADVDYDVTIVLHRIGDASPVAKDINGRKMFYVTMDAAQYTVCAHMTAAGCQAENCILIPNTTIVAASDCSAVNSPATPVLLTMFIMLLMYVPFFYVTHRALFYIGRRRQRPGRPAPRSDALSTRSDDEQYTTALPHNNNADCKTDPSYFNRSYVDLNSADNVIWSKPIRSRHEINVGTYESRGNDDLAPTYEELLPESEQGTKFALGRSPSKAKGSQQNLIDLGTTPPSDRSDALNTEIVMNPGELMPQLPFDRSRVLGAKHGTPHFNSHIPPSLLGPGNYEDLYDDTN